jgi:hypothetical protein
MVGPEAGPEQPARLSQVTAGEAPPFEEAGAKYRPLRSLVERSGGGRLRVGSWTAAVTTSGPMSRIG